MKTKLLCYFALLCASFTFYTCSPEVNNQFITWKTYNGDPGGTRYSLLDQINTSNVRELEQAWVFHTGDHRVNPPSTIECTPLVVDSLMYLTSPALKVYAIHAATGQEIWRYDPFADRAPGGVNRGVTYWENSDMRRILFVAGSHLYALDALTGNPVRGFGDDGRVDLKRGLGRDVSEVHVSATSPGVIHNNVYIIGSMLTEGPGPAAPGHIRAYDVRTGEQKWIFHTIPHPGEFGYETWPEDAWEYSGGANSWAGMTVDYERGMVFAPTGSATYDHYGGDRMGKNLFANSVLALDANTGKRIWHYQLVHHDIWDYDVASPPTLATIEKDGQTVDVVAQPTKMGHLFLFHRDTGEPVFPVEERAVPQSTLPGEYTWPTQPFPTKPPAYAVQGFDRDFITNISPEAHAAVLERFNTFGPSVLFEPPSLDGAITMPQFNGGSDWGGASFDPESGILYVNASNVAETITMIESRQDDDENQHPGERIYRVNCAPCHGLDLEGDSQSIPGLTRLPESSNTDSTEAIIKNGRGQMPSFPNLTAQQVEVVVDYLHNEETLENIQMASDDGFRYPPFVSTGHKPFRDPNDYPANKPPWGVLNAIDLSEGKIIWQVTLGEHADLLDQGIPPTGTFNMGGSIVTAGGLVFIGATKDEKFRAFDKATGKILWEYQLDAGAYATPCTYEIRGRQYVVIAAGGGGKPGTRSGDAYVAFALP